MNITQRIRNFIASNHIVRWLGRGYAYPLEISAHKFGETIYINIAQLLTDIYAELVWTTRTETSMWKAWKAWVDRNGQRVILRLLTGKGYVVVGYHSQVDAAGNVSWAFYELADDKYTTRKVGDVEKVVCKDATQLYFVLRSPTFEQTGMSDHDLCHGYIKMIDAVLNGATTTAERLGAYVMLTPKSDNFGGTLDEQEKDELEKETEKSYGMLKGQKQVMILPRPMDASIVSLAQADIRMNDKARLAILAIADRLKVPANQIAIIDGGQSKSFANGTEYREGDMAKYRSFRRLIDSTLYDMAVELGMHPDYVLENEPKSPQGQTIENQE